MKLAAPAKLNLSLVVGRLRGDGKHEVVTVMAPLALADEIELESAENLSVEGYRQDTLVRGALEALAAAAGTDPRWRVSIEKRVPVATGLGGGSSDAAAALRLANETLREPLGEARLHELAAKLGADVPFFLTPGPKLARGDGTTLRAIELPRDFDVLLLLPDDLTKSSTADVYRAFDERAGERGFEERVARLEDALGRSDLPNLPRNDLTPLTGGADGLAALSIGDFIGDPDDPLASYEDRMRACRGLGALERVPEVAIVAVPDINIQPLAPPRYAPLPPCVPDPCLPPPPPAPATPLPSSVGDLPPVFTEQQIFAVQAAMIEHCERRRDRIALLDPPYAIASR